MEPGTYVGFRATLQEKQLVKSLASQLRRTESDVLRLLVVGAARELGITTQPTVLGQDQGTVRRGEREAVS